MNSIVISPSIHLTRSTPTHVIAGLDPATQGQDYDGFSAPHWITGSSPVMTWWVKTYAERHLQQTFFVQILPLRIQFLDQLQLPSPWPFLQILLSLNGIRD